MTSKYLSLDQALQTTGWAIYEGDTLVTHGHFTISSTKPIEQRLGAIWKELNALYDTYEFDELFYEDIQKQQNAETYKKLAYVQAAVLLWCFFKDVRSTCLGPSHWRSVLSSAYNVSFGKTRPQQKAAAQQLVKDKFQVEATEDECDAICIGLAAIQEKSKKVSAF